MPPTSSAVAWERSGLQTARRLVERGARHLLLLGRSGLPPRATWPSSAGLDETTRERITVIQELESRGANVRVLAVDVSDRPALAKSLKILEELPPLRGVFHLAGMLDDGVLQNQTRERLEKVFAAKARGASIWTN